MLSKRWVLLVAGIYALSLADLYLTTVIGFEANPLFINLSLKQISEIKLASLLLMSVPLAYIKYPASRYGLVFTAGWYASIVVTEICQLTSK